MILVQKITNKIRNLKFKKEINLQGISCYVGKGYHLVGGKYVIIGENFSADHDLYLQAWDSYLGHPTGMTPSIEIGKNVSMMSNCQLSAMNYIKIGDGTLLGDNVFITDNFHGAIKRNEMDIPPLQRNLISKGGVTIGKNVWIGRNVCIMPGVLIGEGSVIGANAVVTHSIPDHCVAAGVPARVIKTITDGDFWADDTKDAVKKSAAEETGVTYVDLAEIQDNPNYEADMGTMVEGDDGKEHEIEHSGVAMHPGDTGMKWIAKKIVEAIEK